MARIPNLTRIEDAPPLLAHEQMTLRDYFAAAALPAVIAACKGDTVRAGESIGEVFARNCYTIADAMLAERAK